MTNNIRTMEYISLDDWHRPVYKCVETGVLWKDLSQDSKNPELYSCQNSMDGEPDCPIKKELEIRYNSKYEENPYRFDYMMLGRMQCDCEAHLGVSNRTIEDVVAHIEEMKRLYNKFPAHQKPEWLTWEQILEYEKAMVVK